MSSIKLMELPHDVLLDIFTRLPATSLFQFRCVSKSIRKLVDDPAFAAMHNEHADVEVRVLPDIFLYHLEFISCGLLGFTWFRHPYGTFGLYNPLKREYLWPPQPEVEFFIVSQMYGMGFDSVTNTYKIVHLYYDRYKHDTLVAFVHVLGTSSWRGIPSVPPCNFVSRNNAYAYGNMFWLLRENRIIYFDFGKEEFRWTSPPHQDFQTNRDESEVFLINLRGSLALVVLFVKKIDIWVHREKQHWTKDYSMSLSCFGAGINHRSSVGAWEHGIYISIPYVIHSTVVYYDLRSHSTRGVPDVFVHRKKILNMFSYKGSLISLKKYENLSRNNKNQKNYFESDQFPEYLTELKTPRIKQLDYGID